MTDRQQPVMLLDVDGVLNAFKPSWGVELTRAKIGFPIRYAQPMIDRLRALHLSGTVDMRWSTTWCGFPEQLDRLKQLFGLDLPSAFGDRPPSKTWGDLKVEAALAVIEEGRRLIWVDDSEIAAGRRLFPALAVAELYHRALLVEPVSELGLQPAHFDLIESFAAAARAPAHIPQMRPLSEHPPTCPCTWCWERRNH